MRLAFQVTKVPNRDDSFIFEEAKRNGWIEDLNWSHYDMVHAIMPTETLSKAEMQEQLYECYRSFYGPWKRKLQGAFSSNSMKRRVFRHMAGRSILEQFKSLFMDALT